MLKIRMKGRKFADFSWGSGRKPSLPETFNMGTRFFIEFASISSTGRYECVFMHVRRKGDSICIMEKCRFPRRTIFVFNERPA